MKTRNAKKKKDDTPNALPAKEKIPGNDAASQASPGKKNKPARIPSDKSLGKQKKSSVLKKTVKKPLKDKKDLPARSAKAAKKASVSKSPSKKAEIKDTLVTLPAPATTEKVSPGAKKEVLKKIRAVGTIWTKKTTVPGIKPFPAKKPERVTKPATGREGKKAPLQKNKEVLQRVSHIELPEEYGENDLIVIAVDPNMIYVDWEIRKKEARRASDGFTMRIFDVTKGGETLNKARESFLDIQIKDRVGRAFFELGVPGRKVTIEIGYYERGKFLPVLRSSAVSLPRLLTIDELGFALKLLESGIPVGY